MHLIIPLLILLLLPSPGRASELQDDLRARRTRAMEQLGPDAMLVVFSAPVRVYSNDVEYEYRQDSNLYYLTGIEQDGTVLVLMPGNRTQQAVLFIKPRDPVREHWEGELLSKDAARQQSGIETVYLATEFEPFMDAILAGSPYGGPAYGLSLEYEAFFAALQQGRARLAILSGTRPTLSQPLDPSLEFANRAKARFTGFSIQDASTILRDLRRIKTPYEQKILEQSVEISSDAHIAGMQAARPGRFEYEVEAAIEHVFLARGAAGWAYPSIVASGPNATILHYNASRRRMEPGDLLLVDAGASYQNMAADVTRTYPVSGTFSDIQRDIYRIVLAAQEEAIKVATPGSRIVDIHQKTVDVIKRGLLDLGLITDLSGDQYRIWYTHGASHYIGLDVHDVGLRDQPLLPGVAFTIEPGIYIREGALDLLTQTPENLAFINRVRPAYEKYKSIGVRVEDSFLLTQTGLKRLSAKVPRTIEEIERLMKDRPAVSSTVTR